MDAYVERKVIEQVAEGDETAFTLLFNAHRTAIYKTALHITGSATTAEDVLQEVFMIIWLNREKLPAIENFRAYLQAIARNHIVRSFKRTANLRSAIAELSHIVDKQHQDTENAVQVKEFEKILQSAVATLSPRQAAVYTLTREKGFSRNQVAKQLDVYPETVKSHMEVAMKKIKAYCLAHITGCVLFFFH